MTRPRKSGSKSASVPKTRAPTAASGRTARRVRHAGDWREETLARMRFLILEAEPAMIEERKWKKPSNLAGVPVWSHHGIVCTGETYRNVVKLTFMKGASLPDPAGLFNASLDAGTRRAIDIHEGEQVNAAAFKALVKAAVARNRPAAKQPTLLAGGNPQIAKAEGDAPVQAHIAAMPGWKRVIGKRLDALVTRAVPGVRKAVKWNSPFYGVQGRGWFLSFHVYTKYVKVTFFNGTSLRPVPPGGKAKEARWVDVHEHDLDEAQLTAWITQAARLPGWMA